MTRDPCRRLRPPDAARLGAPPPHPVPTTVGAMEQRILGRTGRPVSTVGLGTWQLGADWGDVDESTALDVLAAAVDSGVTLFDTADVYGDGRSEQLIGQVPARASRRRRPRRHQDGPPTRAGAAELRAAEFPRVERPVAAQPGRRLPRSRPAALSAHRRLQLGRSVRRPRHHGRRGADRQLRRQRGARRRGARPPSPART